MYQSIGEVYLRSIIKQKTLPPSQTVNERPYLNLPYNLTTNTNTRLREIEIRGYAFNDAVKTRKEYITDISALMKRSAAYNRIQIEDIDGYLEIVGTEIRNTQEHRNMFIIFAKVLPFNDYMPYYMYKKMKHAYTYTDFFPSYLVMPFGTTILNIANTLREYLQIPVHCNIVTPEGNLPIFKFKDWKDNTDATYTGTLTSFDDTQGYTAVVLNTDQENISWTYTPSLIDFTGNITFTLFCSLLNSSSDSVNVTIKDSNDVLVLTQNFNITNTTQFITLNQVRLSPYTEYTITAKKNTANAGDIVMGGIRVIDTSAVRKIEFNTPAPNMNKGECKIFDTVTLANTTRSTWKRIYYPNAHKFTGNIVFENATMQWKINPNTTWSATGILTDRISNYSGKLYPNDYGTSNVILGIDDVKPDRIIVDIKLKDEVNKKAEHAIIEITPVAIFVTTIPLMPSLSNGWEVTMANTVSKGVLNDSIKSLTMLTTTSSVSIMRSSLLTEYMVTPYDSFDQTSFNYTQTEGGFYTYDNTIMNTGYTFVVTILPRVSYTVGKQYLRTAITGADFYVDGEFVDTTKKITLNDFVTSLFESGILINQGLAHKRVL